MNQQATWARIGLRLARITWACALAAGRMAIIAVTVKRSARASRLTAEMVRAIEQLGGAFIKVGQIVATRVDLVGPTVADGLNRLHDHVAPMAASEAIGVVRQALGPGSASLARALASPPVASGSIASVYRVRLADRTVALKVRRPGVGQAIAADLAIIRALAKAATKAPAFRHVPVVEIIDQIGRCLTGQLDFAAEACSLRQMRDHLSAVPGIHVPDVVPQLCGDGVMAMEFVEGLTHASIEQLPEPARREELTVLVRAVYHLLFTAGFVHVDLHQGNTYFRPDGTVVLLDAGFTYRLSRGASRSFTQFFGGMIEGDCESCAEILYSTIRSTTSRAAPQEFRKAIAGLVRQTSGSLTQDFDLSVFCVRLFDLQRRYGLFAEPEFIFPMLCLLGLEGLVKTHYPLLDFQIEAAPYVMQSLLAEPPDERRQAAFPPPLNNSMPGQSPIRR